MTTLTETVESIRAGQTTATQTIQACLERIEKNDGHLHAFVSVDSKRALARAELIDNALKAGKPVGPLAGAAVAVKDNLCTDFAATTCASRMLAEYRPPYNAHVVECLERAGAIVLGKTNLDEFAMGSSTENSGIGVTCNPWQPDHVPGGSSGGSAVAVAAGMVPAALGSDTGGSIRQPASFCGLVGLKPTYGRVSRYGLVAFASSLDQVGPFTRTAADAALMLEAIAGYDGRDSTCADQGVPRYAEKLGRSLEGVRIGLPAEYFGEGLHETVRASIDEATKVLVDLGAKLVEISLPHTSYAIACYYLIATAEASSNLARYDGIHYGHRSKNAQDIMELSASSRGEALGPEVKRRIMLGTYALSSGYYDAYYKKASQVRTLIAQDFAQAFEKVDAILSPVTPTTAFAIGEKTDDPLAMYLADIYTISANLAGICAVSVPCGFDPAGLPIGYQLMGAAFQEETVLAIAHQYQQHSDFHRRVPPL